MLCSSWLSGWQDTVENCNTHLEKDLGVAVWCIVKAEHSERPDDAHAWRGKRHEHHALLLVLGPARTALAHEDCDVTPGVCGSARPPLVPVQAPAVAFPAGTITSSTRVLLCCLCWGPSGRLLPTKMAM